MLVEEVLGHGCENIPRNVASYTPVSLLQQPQRVADAASSRYYLGAPNFGAGGPRQPG